MMDLFAGEDAQRKWLALDKNLENQLDFVSENLFADKHQPETFTYNNKNYMKLYSSSQTLLVRQSDNQSMVIASSAY